jgi:hypothetical protein
MTQSVESWSSTTTSSSSDGEGLARLVAPGDRSAVLKDLHQRAVMHGNGVH